MSKKLVAYFSASNVTKKLAMKRSSRKFKKHMTSFMMTKKEVLMTNLVMQHLNKLEADLLVAIHSAVSVDSVVGLMVKTSI